MGNHAAGVAVGLAAELALAKRQPGVTALQLLDRACRKYRNTDAEFEAVDPDDEDGAQHPDFNDYRDPHPKAALGMLMIEAFAPNGLADLPRYAGMLASDYDFDDTAAAAVYEAAYDAWNAEVGTPFRKRYGFC